MRNRKEKRDVTKIQICAIIGLVNIFGKKKMKNSPLAKKISLLVQIGEEIYSHKSTSSPGTSRFLICRRHIGKREDHGDEVAYKSF